MKQKPQIAGLCVDHTTAILITINPSDKTLHISERINAASDFQSESEHTRNNAKHGDLQKFYKAVAEKLIRFDSIMIFGFGKAQEELSNHLKQDARFKNKTVTIEATDKLTDNQKVAFVRDNFKEELAAQAEVE